MPCSTVLDALVCLCSRSCASFLGVCADAPHLYRMQIVWCRLMSCRGPWPSSPFPQMAMCCCGLWPSVSWCRSASFTCSPLHTRSHVQQQPGLDLRQAVRWLQQTSCCRSSK
jgi:hypothetical protein